MPTAVHPLQEYVESHQAARDQLLAEANVQTVLSEKGPDAAIRAQAGLDATELVAKVGQIDAEHTAFLVKVFTETAASGPAQQVVDETIQLNKKLAETVAKANRAAAMLRIVTSYLQGAIAVFNGKVAPSGGGGGG
jgi:hypothetical protein